MRRNPPAILALGIMGVVMVTAASSHAVAADPMDFFHLQSVLPLPSTNTSWDHIDYDQTHKRAYLSRRGDGLTVVDVTTNKVVGQVASSKGAGAVALAPKLDRGFTANTDGSSTIFKLSDLSVIDRVSFGDNFDGTVYDETTNLVAFQQADNSIELLVDASNGKKVAGITVDGTELERPALDGHGGLFLPMRDKSVVYKIDLNARKIAAMWDVSAKCTQPSGADYDGATDRLFLACRGKGVNPVLAVVDGQSGAVTATIPIGRGADDVVFDGKSKTVFVSAGLDSNVVVVKQNSADSYAMTEAFQTRPGARVMRYDTDTGRIFTMTAEGVVDPAKKVLTAISPFYPNTMIPNSFVMLTYARGSGK